jgi:hypothetical protein
LYILVCGGLFHFCGKKHLSHRCHQGPGRRNHGPLFFLYPTVGLRCNARKAAAKEAGVPLETIESAEDVDIVMPKFFAFVGEDILVSTGALGNQAKLISRAARYAGMKEIKNEFYDLLDLAADTSREFDLANNTREYLLSHFAISEGKDARQKAQSKAL